MNFIRTTISTAITQFRIPLFRNAYALILNDGLAALAGFLFWLVAARLFSPALVGLNAAAIAASALIAALAQFSLGGTLMRFLSISGKKTLRFIWLVYGITFVASLLLSVVAIATRHWWMNPDRNFLGEEMWFWFIYGFSIALWSIFTIQDAVLISLRQAIIVPAENFIYGLSRTVFLFVFVQSQATHAIYLAWIIPLLPIILVINAIIFLRLMKSPNLPVRSDPTFNLNAITRFSSMNYIGELFAVASVSLLPLIVVAKLGLEANAYFYQGWLFSAPLLLLPWGLGNSLTVEIVANPSALKDYVRKTLKRMLQIVLPLAVVLFFIAPFILRVYGAAYEQQATTLMRLIILASIPNIASVLFISIARVQHQMKMVTLIRLVLCVFTLSFSVFLLPRIGITGIGVAWLFTHLLVAGVIIAVVYFRGSYFQFAQRAP